MRGNAITNAIKATIRKTTIVGNIAGGILQFMGSVTIQNLVQGNIFVWYADDNSGTGFSRDSAGKWYIGFLATKKIKNDVVAGDFDDWIQFNYLSWPTGPAWPTGAKGDKWDKGDTGDTWPQGPQGIQGIQWDQGIQWPQGVKGDTWQGFRVAKTYSTVASLLADTSPTGIIAGEFALVSTVNGNQDDDNGKLYLWNGTSYAFTTDMSGVNGITGPTWPTGQQWPTGNTWPQGVQGIQWPTGPTWPQGPTWQGVNAGGTTKQILVKRSNDDYDTERANDNSFISSIIYW